MYTVLAWMLSTPSPNPKEMGAMKCPMCGHNDWRRVVKKEPIGVSLAQRKVVKYICTNCGYEKNSEEG